MNSDGMHEFLIKFRQTIEAAADALRQISETDSGLGPAPGKWSPKQIIGHLIDSAANNHSRFVKAQLQDDLVFPGYEQNEWIALQGYRDEPWLQLVDFWRSYNLHLAHLMEIVPKELLTKPRQRHNLDQIAWQTVPQTEPATLEYFIRDYVAHLRNHLHQIPGVL